MSGPASVQEFTGLPTTSAELGGADVHARRSGLASLVVARLLTPMMAAYLLKQEYWKDVH